MANRANTEPRPAGPAASRWRWLVGVFGVVVGLPAAWYFGRPQPPAADEALGEGMRYLRHVRTSPRRVVHEVVVPLDRDRRFVVTPGDPAGERAGERALRAQTVSSFARRHDVLVAINGDFFTPWHSRGPWDYYPHADDPVDVRGFAVADGKSYGGEPPEPGGTLFFPCEGGATTTPPASTCGALSGRAVLVDGREVFDRTGGGSSRHPRTAACLDEAGTNLRLVVVDGRQPGYSVGMSLPELSAQLVELGCHHAINFDGGGSSTLVLRRGGEHEVASTPIHCRIPGWERPIANHLGVGVAPDQ